MNQVCFYTIIILLLLTSDALGQEEKMEIEGAIQIANSEDSTPDAGTIRYNEINHDFEGWNGFFWVSLTGFQTGTVLDIEGNNYITVNIGDQEWMAENLRTTKYRNGDTITIAPLNSDWSNTVNGAYCYYDNDTTFDAVYGKLYNWYTVEDTRGICPVGWHIPDNTEWNELLNFNGGISLAGNKLKEAGIEHWTNNHAGANNESAFTALPGGYRTAFGYFYYQYSGGFYWSLTSSTGASAYWIGMLGVNEYASQGTDDKNEGLSVRCLRD